MEAKALADSLVKEQLANERLRAVLEEISEYSVVSPDGLNGIDAAHMKELAWEALQVDSDE